MSEEDIKLNYITPIILRGWKNHITMETKITDGRINIRGNIVARSKPKYTNFGQRIPFPPRILDVSNPTFLMIRAHLVMNR